MAEAVMRVLSLRSLVRSFYAMKCNFQVRKVIIIRQSKPARRLETEKKLSAVCHCVFI